MARLCHNQHKIAKPPSPFTWLHFSAIFRKAPSNSTPYSFRKKEVRISHRPSTSNMPANGLPRPCVRKGADALASDGPAPPNRKQLALFHKVLSSSGSLIRAHRTLCDTEAVDLTG